MRMIFALLALLALAPASSLASNTGGIELATMRGCFTCHSIQPASAANKPMAPAYQEIAVHYRGIEDAQAYLAERILLGTAYAKQNWRDRVSMQFMPPSVDLTRLEARELAHWILNLPVDEALKSRLITHERMLVLSTRMGCMACHRMRDDGASRHAPLAPSLHDIAERYRETPNAPARLVKSIIEGTSPIQKTWQHVNMQFMPPTVGMQPEQARALAEWILGLE